MLQIPIRIYLNTDSTQIIVKANNGAIYQSNVKRGDFCPQPQSLLNIILFVNDNTSYLWSDILNSVGAPYGIDRDTTLAALTNLGGFNLGGGGGAVTSVNGGIGIVTVNLDSVLNETTALPSGVFAITIAGGVATLTLATSVLTPEEIQDAAFAILTDTSTIDLNYNDAGNQVTADVINNSITNIKVSQMPANTVKVNNTAVLANAVDLPIPQNTVLGRDNLTGNIAALPVQDVISGIDSLVAGSRLLSDIRITANSYAIFTPSSTGVFTSGSSIKYTAGVGTMLCSTGVITDTATFSYLIFIV